MKRVVCAWPDAPKTMTFPKPKRSVRYTFANAPERKPCYTFNHKADNSITRCGGTDNAVEDEHEEDHSKAYLRPSYRVSR